MLGYKYHSNLDTTPLIMIHGFLCGGDLFAPNIKELKKSYTVITIDLPGFASSNQIKTPNQIKGMAKMVVDTIQKLNIENYYLLGHSMGGMVVLQMALMDSEKIKKLIPYATYCSGNLPERYESFDETKKRFQQFPLEEIKPKVCATWFKDGNQHEDFQACLQCGGEISLETILQALDAMKSFDIQKEVKNITISTLLISAENDRTYHVSRLKDLKERIPSSQLKILEHCYHNAHLEKKEKFNQTVLQFLN